MNTHTTYPDTTPTGDERLMDAILHEHARLGTQADTPFLQRLASATSAGAVIAFPYRRTMRAVTASLAAAAAVALVAGLVWKNLPPDGSRTTTPIVVTDTEPADTTGLTVLRTPFPPELIEGTPRPINVPRLVAAPNSAPTLMVPEGTELLSKGKPVTSSDDAPIIGTLDLITDGDKDAGEGYFVELLDGLQWIQIDLEQRADIHAVWVWHFHSQRRAYHDVIIQISDDPDFKKGVTTIYNNDYDNSAGMGKGADSPYVETRFGLLANARGTTGRYVRLYSNGNSSNEMNHYIEVEVFGIAR
jgi:hypothetical protein